MEFHPSPEADAKVRSLIAEVVEPEAKMDLNIHRSKILRTKLPVTRVSITEPKIIEVVQFSPTEFELIGLKPGDSSVTFWFGANQSLRYFINVMSDTEVSEQRSTIEYRKLQNKINELFPNSMVQLIPLADKLIVRGQAKDSAEAAQILSVLSGSGGANSTGVGLGRGRNLVDVGKAVNPAPGDSDIPAHSIINLMEVPGEQQVLLKVRIAQLDRTAARRMATQLRINSGILALNTDSGGLSAVFSSVLNPEDLRLALTAVSSTGYTKILAEPNLVTLNGQSASFQAGGEFPVPTAVGIGGVSGINTQFQRFGTQLTFTPTIIDKDRIRLVVAPSFSAVNRDLTVQGIPGLSNRSAETQVDLRVGQWLAIAGLLEDSQRGTKIRIPFVGDIPIVGQAFGQSSVERTETELIILVSPELVHPMDARETPMVLPGMEIAEPGDTSMFLGGAIVAREGGPHRCSSRCAVPYPAGACPTTEEGSATSCPTAASAQEARNQSARETMSRPEYQRSEKYYVYGQHGTSQ
jgi:pilus assembly protein CpaC